MRWVDSTSTPAPGRVPAVSSAADGPWRSQSKVGHQLSRYSMRGAVMRASSPKTAVSPRLTCAADGTGITHAARPELPVTPNDIKMSSREPSQEISARSSTTAAPA